VNGPQRGGLATRPPEVSAAHAVPAKAQARQAKRAVPTQEHTPEANHSAAGPIPAPRRSSGVAGQPLSRGLADRFAPIVGHAAARSARVHTGPAAQVWARQQRARAVADGVDIYFAEGQFQPGTRAGDALIAHELAHVSQALRGLLDRPACWATVGAERNAMESDADDAARKVTDEEPPGQAPDQTESPPAAANLPPILSETDPQSVTDVETSAPPPQSRDAVAVAPLTGVDVAQALGSDAGAAPAPSEADNVDQAEASVTPDTDAAPTKTADLPPNLPLMPDPPTTLSPVEQSRIAGVQHRATAAATSTAAAPKPEENVARAEVAVAVPQEENNARAAEAVVAELGDTVKPSVEIVALCNRIKDLIRAKRPADEDAVIDSRPEQVANAAGGAVSGDVNKNVDAAKGAYGPIGSTPKGPQPQQPPGIDPIPPAPPAPDVAATAGTPDAVPPERVSLDGDANQMESRADKAGLNKESAQQVKGGPIGEAREARGEMGETAKEDPAEALKHQQEALATSNANMAALQVKALQSLRDARTGHVAGVDAQQQKLKGGAEDLRTKLSSRAQGIYDSARDRVQDLLKDVPSTAMGMWTAGMPPISRTFKDDLKVVAGKVEERHEGVGGFFVAGWDRATGLPDWVKEAYDQAEKDFGDNVCTLITEISVYVNQIIKIADGIIAAAREEISTVFKAELPEADAKWAAEQEKAFGAKLDALHDKAEETRTSFTKELVENAGSAVQAARLEVQELRKKAGGIWGRFLDAVGRFVDDPVKFIIDGLLELVNISPPAFWGVVKKIGEVFGEIADAPVKFANNLISGVKQGFSNFFDNIGRHLLEGLLEWLLSGLKEEGISIQVPKEFSVKSVVGFFLDLLGISWTRIRKLLVEQLGEKAVAAMEKTVGVISMLATKGIGGILDDIKQFLDPQNIVDAILDVAIKYISQTLIVQVALKILKLLNPAGLILEAITLIYDVLKWIFTNAAKIFHLIEAVVNGMADVIAGNVAGVAKTVEKALAMLISPVIDFLAEYLGLGGLPGKVAQAVKGLQGWVEGVMRSVIKWLVELGRKIVRSLGFGGKDDEKDAKKDKNGSAAVGETVAFGDEDESHKLYVLVSGSSATLMVASTPLAAEAWLQKKEEALPDLGDAEHQKSAKDAIARAANLIKKADKEADKVASAKAAATEAGATEPAATAPADATAIQLENQLKKDEETLAEALQDILRAFGAGKPSGKWSVEIAKADPNAIPLITKVLDATPKKFLHFQDWVAITEALDSDSKIHEATTGPLLLAHGFGEAAHSQQAVPAVDRAIGALGDKAPEEMKAEEAVTAYKAQVHAGKNPFFDSVKSLARQFFAVAEKVMATTTLQKEFTEKLSRDEQEEHDRFEPVKIVVLKVQPDGRVLEMEYLTKAGTHFHVTFDTEGMVKSVLGYQLSMKVPGSPRGRTERAGRKVTGQGLDSSHLIADIFGGSGFRRSANLIAVSAKYNQVRMRAVENEITDWLEENGLEQRFTMQVNVTWGQVAGAQAIAEIEAAHPGYPTPKKRKGLEKELADFLGANSVNLKRCLSTEYIVASTDGILMSTWTLGADIDLGLKK
jgi:hypothetical protein